MVVIHITRAKLGGSGSYSQRLSLALNEIGIQSKVLFTDEPSEPIDGIRLVSSKLKFSNRLTKSFIGRIAKRPFHSLLFTNSLQTDHISGAKVIHLHGINGAAGPFQFWRRIPQNSPVFWTIHDMWPLTGGCLVYNGCRNFESNCCKCPALKAPFHSIARLDLLQKKHISNRFRIQPIANSSWTAKQISKSAVFSCFENVPVVHPIMASEFRPVDRLAHGNLNLKNGKPRIALGARAITDEFKGIPQFLNALAGRPHLASRVEVLLFGDGKYDFPSGINVESKGKIKSPIEMSQFFQGVDFFISPSRMETFGMSVAEAQACGVRVLAFDVGGVGDAMHPEGGVLVKDNDFGGLLDVLEKELVGFRSDDSTRLKVAEEIRFQFCSKTLAEKQKIIYERHLEQMHS